MKIGFVYPQTEFGNDPMAIRDLAQSAEGLGYSHVLAYEHVLGVNPDSSEVWDGPYDFKSSFQSPFLLFSFMAAVTDSLGFTTGILILPQRQTVLAAKQAATLDVLSNGRLRLGIGIGWNKPEYVALGENFHNRGQRIEEQVNLMRQLWTQPLVNFSGRWHNIPDAGINPLPIQQPIPIWFGGHADQVLRRIATIGDGWIPNYRSADEAGAAFAKIERYLNQAGRNRTSIGIEARIRYADGDAHTWEQLLLGWQNAGVSHISFNTMVAGFDTPAQHLEALKLFASTMEIANR
jgi:probable F420-dependent oxidoreductase